MFYSIKLKVALKVEHVAHKVSAERLKKFEDRND